MKKQSRFKKDVFDEGLIATACVFVVGFLIVLFVGATIVSQLPSNGIYPGPAITCPPDCPTTTPSWFSLVVLVIVFALLLAFVLRLLYSGPAKS